MSVLKHSDSVLAVPLIMISSSYVTVGIDAGACSSVAIYLTGIPLVVVNAQLT